MSTSIFSAKIQNNRQDKSIVIVGAGVAGIAAATRLIEAGFTNVKIYEAGLSKGGRIVSMPWASNVIDLGAQWYELQFIKLYSSNLFFLINFLGVMAKGTIPFGN